jgi:hypothetical protein
MSRKLMAGMSGFLLLEGVLLLLLLLGRKAVAEAVAWLSSMSSMHVRACMEGPWREQLEEGAR